jgi:hypothetical protein
MNKTDKDFLVRLLPDHYVCRFRETGINCQSEKGIDENDPEQWDYTFKAIKQYYGERFLEVNHITNTDHKNFTVYLKMAENEKELRMEAAKEMASKSALSGVGGGEKINCG